MSSKPTTARRQDGWEKAFNAEVEAALTRPFAWGHFDCCLFAADCVRAITGTDIAAGYRSTYESRMGALELVEREGGLEAMIDRACSEHGLEPRRPEEAQRGDVVILNGVDGFTVTAGICVGTRAAVPAPERGLSFVPMVSATRVWHVQHSSKCPQSSQQ